MVAPYLLSEVIELGLWCSMIVPYLLITITESLPYRTHYFWYESRKPVNVIAEWSLLTSCLREGSDRTRPAMLNDRSLSLNCDHRIIALPIYFWYESRKPVNVSWVIAPYLLSVSRKWSNSACILQQSACRLWSLNDRSLPLVWEQEVIELGLHLAAERLPTVIAEWSLLTSCPRAGSDRTRPASCSRAPGDCDRWDSWWGWDDRRQLSRSHQGQQHLFSGGKEELFLTLGTVITKKIFKDYL
jgi:hypothetical protein